MSVSEDWEWSDEYMPIVKEIVGPHLLQKSPYAVDAKQATDLVVVRGKSLTTGVRMRRPYAAENWPYQFTIRLKRDSGAKTELAKIIDGWGDIFFYGFAGDAHQKIQGYYLIDLNVFRKCMIYEEPRKSIVSGRQSNKDGTHFKWFDVRSFSEEMFLDSKHRAGNKSKAHA
jgi:hypothetical protein